MKIKTIKDIEEIKGKKILLRVDFNVPMKDGVITDNTRIQKSIPTIEHLLNEGAAIVLMSHLGRPEGKQVDELSLKPIAKELEKLLKKPVKMLKTVLDDSVKAEAEKLESGNLMMLENLRFRAEEEENSETFSKELSELADIYVNDAFGTAHRAHASTEGVANHLPAFGGFLMENEIENLSPILDEDELIHPVTMIFGGAKIDTKIGIIKKFIDETDFVLTGGALSNTFLAAAGYNVAESLYEEDQIETARETMLEYEKHHERFILPHDVRVASEIKEGAETLCAPIQDIEGDMQIIDIGNRTIEKYCNVIKQSGTVIWNGPVGVHEIENFAVGTKAIAECISEHNCVSILGGGDTVDAINNFGIPEDKFTHVSTGGGASLEFLEGKELPGIKALLA